MELLKTTLIKRDIRMVSTMHEMIAHLNSSLLRFLVWWPLSSRAVSWHSNVLPLITKGIRAVSNIFAHTKEFSQIQRIQWDTMCIHRNRICQGIRICSFIF